MALPTEAGAFVAQLRQRLVDTAERGDGAFPDNAHAAFVGEELVVRRHSKQAASAALLRVDQQLIARLAPKNILDILVEGERWLDLHKLFGPLSGFEGKIDNPRLRFVTTLFCYGCNLGPHANGPVGQGYEPQASRLAELAPHDRGAAGKSLGAGHQRLQQVNRFGDYSLDLERQVPPMQFETILI